MEPGPGFFNISLPCKSCAKLCDLAPILSAILFFCPTMISGPMKCRQESKTEYNC
jgi:hypothetical protein